MRNSLIAQATKPIVALRLKTEAWIIASACYTGSVWQGGRAHLDGEDGRPDGFRMDKFKKA